MVQLPEPDHRLAKHVMRTVPYRGRFEAGRMMPRTGISPVPVRSLQQVRMLLAPRKDVLPGINFEALAQWLRISLGDHALADAVLMAAGEAYSYVECCIKIYEIINLRLDQAKAFHSVQDVGS